MDNREDSILSVLAISVVNSKGYDSRLFDIVRNDTNSGELQRALFALEEALKKTQAGRWPEQLQIICEFLKSRDNVDCRRAGYALDWAIITNKRKPRPPKR